MGVIGLETAFAVLNTELVLPGLINLATLVDKLSSGAALFDFPAPAIAVGAPADICLADLADKWHVGEAGYESRSANSCFSGRELTGRVKMTIAAGSVAYRERTFAIGLA
jgi:dihydroorotase